MMRRVALLVLAVLGTASTPALAGERWDVAAAAAEVLAATASDRDAKLKAAAAGPWSPWMFAEHLRARGAAPEILVAYANLVQTEAPKLRAYVEDGKRGLPTVATLTALESARAHLTADEPEAALTALLAAKDPPGTATVAAAAHAWLQARCYESLVSMERCVRAALRAGDVADSIGWRHLAAKAYRLGMGFGLAAGLLEETRACALGLLAIREAEGDSEGVAAAHHDLGGIDYARGDFSGALRSYDEALALYQAMGRPGDAADVRSLRAVVYALMGDFRRALDDLREIGDDESLFPDPEALADHNAHAAIVYTQLGDVEKALAYLEKSLAIARRTKDTVAEAVSHGNLGIAHRTEGRWEEAIKAYRRALPLFAAAGAGLDVATSKLAIADAHVQAARSRMRAASGLPKDEHAAFLREAHEACRSALQLLDEALAVLGPAGAAGPAAAAQCARCEVLLTQGDLEGLAEQFARVADEAERLRLWKVLISGSTGIVATHLERGAWTEAIRVARGAAGKLIDGYGGITDREIARARSFDASVFDLGVRAAAQAGRIEDLHYFLETGHATALLQGMGGRAAALRAMVPGDLIEELRQKTAAKATAMAAFSKARRSRDRMEQVAKRNAYRLARDAELEILEQIQAVERSAAERLVSPRVEVLADLSRKLRPRSADAPPTLYLAFNLQLQDAWCLIADAGAQRYVHLGPEHVHPIQAALADLVAERHGEFSPATLDALRTHLIAPLGLPSGPVRYIIAPDRELAYVPYAAILPDEAAVSLVPSATTYAMLLDQVRKRGTGTLGVGDPDYGGVADKDVFAARGGAHLGRLPQARAELMAATGGPHDVRLMYEKATEEGLAALLKARGEERRWHIVHFVCHGLVDVEWPALSALALTPSAKEDGLLTAAEILRLPIRADLAILSACETGRGRYVRGEGIMGLVRAFMLVGTPRVLASLWKVEDKASAFLMNRFHAELKAGSPTARALRRAQLAVRDHVVETKDAEGKVVKDRPWEEPRYWAAWVLWGLPD